MDFSNFTRYELEKLIVTHAKNWLAHDGCWFLAVEERFDLKTAIELDKKSWERFSAIEARRIMEDFNIERGGGLISLEKALKYRLYAFINLQKIEWSNKGSLIYTMQECRVQQARERKKLPLFPCKEVGLIEYTIFAKTIDERIQTICIACPPDELKGDYHCKWEFFI